MKNPLNRTVYKALHQEQYDILLVKKKIQLLTNKKKMKIFILFLTITTALSSPQSVEPRRDEEVSNLNKLYLFFK